MGPTSAVSELPACWEWPLKYFDDCVRSPREATSLALGLISVALWGVAEMPQIIGNWLEGRSEGVAAWFLATWTLGDFLNVAGCVLSNTLPTQLYTAIMYTLVTLLLDLQHMYYNVKCPMLPSEEMVGLLPTKIGEPMHLDRHVSSDHPDHPPHVYSPKQTPLHPPSLPPTVPEPAADLSPALNLQALPTSTHPVDIPHTPPGCFPSPFQDISDQTDNIPDEASSADLVSTNYGSPSSIDTPSSRHYGSLRSISTYHSGRLLAAWSFSSCASRELPPSPTSSFYSASSARRASFGSFGSLPGIDTQSQRNATTPDLEHGPSPTASRDRWTQPFVQQPPQQSDRSAAGHRTQSAPLVDTQAVGGDDDAEGSDDDRQPSPSYRSHSYSWRAATPVLLFAPYFLFPDGGKSLGLHISAQHIVRLGLSSEAWGQILGWLMTVVYISGRLPQILHNAKRRSTAGLSMAMFSIVIAANVTYILSILVRSLAWQDIKPRLPWLVDAALCLLADFVIMAQFFFYRHTGKPAAPSRRHPRKPVSNKQLEANKCITRPAPLSRQEFCT